MAIRSLAVLGLLLLVLQACGILPQTGPPEPNGWEVASHGRP